MANLRGVVRKFESYHIHNFGNFKDVQYAIMISAFQTGKVYIFAKYCILLFLKIINLWSKYNLKQLRALIQFCTSCKGRTSTKNGRVGIILHFVKFFRSTDIKLSCKKKSSVRPLVWPTNNNFIMQLRGGHKIMHRVCMWGMDKILNQHSDRYSTLGILH